MDERAQGAVSKWLRWLKREATAPDLWREIAKARSEVTFTSKDNTPLTIEEQKYIATRTLEIKSYIFATVPSIEPAKQHLVEGQLSYLVDASSRLGRKDWYNILNSVIFSIVIAAVFAPERARELFRMVWDFFSPLIRSLPQLP